MSNLPWSHINRDSLKELKSRKKIKNGAIALFQYLNQL